jgi:hypothetical protein
MSGTLFGLGLSQQHDIDGRPMSGARLYIYFANSTTPAVAYSSPGLAPGSTLPWPLVADSAGRIPAFWLNDGAYRARLTDENGVVQFDVGEMLAVGSGTGDIITSNVPAEAILTTGCVLWMPVADVKVGWVRLNGRTIGNVSSGGSERANADCQALFEYLWSNFGDAICPVPTGRGGSASADWAANKQLTLLDMRGKTGTGLDDMGNTPAGILAGVAFDAGNATTGGANGGDATVALTIPNLPPYTPTGTNSAGVISTQVRGRNDTLGAGPTLFATTVASATNPQATDSSVHTTPPVFTGTPQGGTSAPVQNISPFVLGTWFMRL